MGEQSNLLVQAKPGEGSVCSGCSHEPVADSYARKPIGLHLVVAALARLDLHGPAINEATPQAAAARA